MNFLTLVALSEGEFKDRGSKFYAYAYPVFSKEDVKAKLDYLRKRYHDARHHCFAYVLGMDCQNFRANDDGEPKHSAGDPILGQIRSFGLTNTLVVVAPIKLKGGSGGQVRIFAILPE